MNEDRLICTHCHRLTKKKLVGSHYRQKDDREVFSYKCHHCERTFTYPLLDHPEKILHLSEDQLTRVLTEVYSDFIKGGTTHKDFEGFRQNYLKIVLENY